jgi:hypothetical protein
MCSVYNHISAIRKGNADLCRSLPLESLQAAVDFTTFLTCATRLFNALRLHANLVDLDVAATCMLVYSAARSPSASIRGTSTSSST